MSREDKWMDLVLLSIYFIVAMAVVGVFAYGIEWLATTFKATWLSGAMFIVGIVAILVVLYFAMQLLQWVKKYKK